MFNNGTVVNSSVLSQFFRQIFKRLNELTANELNALTSGQFQRDGHFAMNPTDFRSDVMNVHSEQYFDNHTVAKQQYLRYYNDWLDDIEG